MAETTTSTWLAASASRRTRSATLRMRSIPAIDVPPNFITMRDIGGLLTAVRAGATVEPLGHPVGGDQRFDVHPWPDHRPTVSVDQHFGRKRARVVGARHRR